jgi:hypothetical protein
MPDAHAHPHGRWSRDDVLAEDGNKLPGLARKQGSVFMAAGKTNDVLIEPNQAAATCGLRPVLG